MSERALEESKIRQHPWTRGHGSDGPFLGEAKFTHSAYHEQSIHILSV